MNLAIVGAGWAGLAAAVHATESGHQVAVFEAARHAGGRARSVVQAHDGRTLTLDNGQHIMIGAYTETLALMRAVGVDPVQALLRLPLDLRLPDGSGIALPDRAPPWDALAGILGARGLGWRDKAALLAATTRWQLAGFRCAPQTTVAALCASLPARVQQTFVEPLCLSALNTAASQASASVFLRVLHDSLMGGRGGSNMLIPRRPLGALFPEPAIAWLQARGQSVQLGTRVNHWPATAGSGASMARPSTACCWPARPGKPHAWCAPPTALPTPGWHRPTHCSSSPSPRSTPRAPHVCRGP